MNVDPFCCKKQLSISKARNRVQVNQAEHGECDSGWALKIYSTLLSALLPGVGRFRKENLEKRSSAFVQYGFMHHLNSSSSRGSLVELDVGNYRSHSASEMSETRCCEL